MKLNLLNQVFSFHDFHLTNIEDLSNKIILHFDQGIYFENTPKGQADYMMINPRLVLYKNEKSFSKEDLEELIEDTIQSFDPDFKIDDGLEDLDHKFNYDLEINFYKDGTYKKISLEELLKLDFEIINESFGYGYMRFSGIVTGFSNLDEWQNASLEIYYSNEAELLFDSLEKL